MTRLTHIRNVLTSVHVAKELQASRKSGPVRRCRDSPKNRTAERAAVKERIKTADGRKHPDPLILIVHAGRILARILGPPGPQRIVFRGEVG